MDETYLVEIRRKDGVRWTKSFVTLFDADAWARWRVQGTSHEASIIRITDAVEVVKTVRAGKYREIVYPYDFVRVRGDRAECRVDEPVYPQV